MSFLQIIFVKIKKPVSSKGNRHFLKKINSGESAASSAAGLSFYI